jgi:hypothetical protein
MIVGDHRHGLHDRMAGTQLLGLQHPVDALVLERGLDLAPPWP